MKSFRAMWKGKVIAEASSTVLVEGNHYFHRDSVKMDLLTKIPKTTHCPWKGDAAYYDLTVDGETNPGCVWTYPIPSQEAMNLKDHFAFWNGVEVVGESDDERLESVTGQVKSFYTSLMKINSDDYKGIFAAFQKSLEQMGPEYLTFSLPTRYINELSFFNFANANNACFHTDRDSVVIRVNPTFEWALNHLPSFMVLPLKDGK